MSGLKLTFVVMRGDFFPWGGRSRIFSVGGSVARARAANVSMMRLTQRSCTAVRTGFMFSWYTAVTKANRTAVMLTVIWNWDHQQVSKVTMEPETYLKELLNCVVNSPAPLQSCHDRRKVVIHEHDGGCLLGYLSTGDSHGEAHISSLESRCIVRSVSSHSNGLTKRLEFRHQNSLVLRRRSSKDL